MLMDNYIKMFDSLHDFCSGSLAVVVLYLLDTDRPVSGSRQAICVRIAARLGYDRRNHKAYIHRMQI